MNRSRSRNSPRGRLRVVLSYSHDDKEIVQSLYDRLCDDGFDPWMRDQDILPGQNRKVTIQNEVREAAAVIFCLSETAVSSAGDFQREINYALDVAEEQLEESIFIIPAMLEDCEVPSRLSQRHPVKLYDRRGYPRLMQALNARAYELGFQSTSRARELRQGRGPTFSTPRQRERTGQYSDEPGDNALLSEPLVSWLNRGLSSLALGLLLILILQVFTSVADAVVAAVGLFAGFLVFLYPGLKELPFGPLFTSTKTTVFLAAVSVVLGGLCVYLMVSENDVPEPPIEATATQNPEVAATQVAAAVESTPEAAAAQTAASLPHAPGHQIAFTSNQDGNLEIYVMNADGSGQTNLSNHPGLDAYPSWSPDGQQIAFTSERNGRSEIYVMNADGSGQRKLSNNPAEERNPSWSPVDQRIAFTSNRDDNSEIYVMNADGSGQTNLSNHSADDYDPAWSPDGQRIAFASYRDGNLDYPEIYVMNADGSGQRNLSNVSASGTGPAWSPDGRRIAFMSNRHRNFEIYVMNADGSEQTNLSNHSADDYEPAWSRDGKRIAFASKRDGDLNDLEIYVMNADGSGQTRLTEQLRADFSPNWRP